MEENYKLSFDDILDYLLKIDKKHEESNSRNLLIIGGSSLMMQNINSRITTADVDSFELIFDDPSYLKKVTNILKNDQSLTRIFNSKALNAVEEVFQYVNEYTEILIGEFENLNIFVPTPEVMIVLKILSYHDSIVSYGDIESKHYLIREKDILDLIAIKDSFEIDFDKVNDLIVKTCSKKYDNRFSKYKLADLGYIFEKINQS